VEKAALESSLSALDIWLIVFGVFVAIGVVGESVVGFLHWRRSGQLQVIQTTENLAQRAEILRLEAAIQPRRLGPEQQKAISDALVSFAGRKALLRSYSFDTDGLVLGKQIMGALTPRIGGVDSIGAVTPVGGPLSEGVSITGSDAAFVNALTSAFAGIGKLSVNNDPPRYGVGSMMTAPAVMPPTDVTIFVGVKPLPP